MGDHCPIIHCLQCMISKFYLEYFLLYRYLITVLGWVVSGIEACMKSKCPIDEEPYEISLDNHDCSDGPKTGRLRVLNNVCSFSLSYHFVNIFLLNGLFSTVQIAVLHEIFQPHNRHQSFSAAWNSFSTATLWQHTNMTFKIWLELREVPSLRANNHYNIRTMKHVIRQPQ